MLLLLPVVGFFIFLAEVQAATNAKPRKADAIVVLSGEPRRILVAADLLKHGFGPQLIIVGQDNAQEIDQVRAEHPASFACCVKVDQRSKSTAEDAQLAAHLLRSSHPNSVLLVTSSFHVPRARVELQRVLPHSTINVHGIPDDLLKPERILSDSQVASAFVSQYLKYIASCVSSKRVAPDGGGVRQALHFLSDIRTIAALAILVLTSMFLIFAVARHRRQRSALGRSAVASRPAAGRRGRQS